MTVLSIRVRLSIVSILLGILSMPLGAADVAAQSAAERRENLARITEKLNDPDPFMRLAHMEEIIGAGRALDSQIAIKMALASEDSDLRNVALRAYMSTVRDLRLDIALPPKAAAEHAAAQGDKKKESLFARAWRPVLFYYNGLSRRFNVEVAEADMAAGRFKVFAKNNLKAVNEQYSGGGSVVGSRISFDINVFVSNQARRCSVELRPGSDLVLRGEMSCARASTPLPVEMPLY